MSFEINYEEDLVPRIRDLIDGYSKNSILKEYLQNADDSGATELVVTFDKRIHTSLINTEFEVAKETALLLFNNANFDDKDFEAIVKISAQGKIEDANSTGRFGQGFSSSFSISDHPSFVSSGRAYWFDVLGSAVAKGKNKSIQGWDLKLDNKEIMPWLKTFNSDDSFSGTIFRLPLRNSETAKQSDISHEIFKYEDFLIWCDEWKDNASGLLFLRHVHKLVLQEINENNEKIIHVEISTKNSEEIQDYNCKLQEEFDSSLLNICKGWKSRSRNLPLFTYKHHFSVKNFDRDKKLHHDVEECWAVVNGLFPGRSDNLIDQAIKVLSISPNPRKVLPWAGVAISLDEKGNVKKHKRSNYHTFLPLPIKSKHPVHIHAWFDLNPKRTEITYDGAGDDKTILIEWNRLLFKEGVGTAWAYLIDFIKDNCDPRSYYSLWPKDYDDEFDKYLLEGFYEKITEIECFSTRYKKEQPCWNKPNDNIFYFQNNSDKRLPEAFKQHFSIISPKPTTHIIKNLSDIGTELEEITPKFIRDYLNRESEELDFPYILENTPIAMLSKKEWLLSILIYCAEADEDKDYSYLEGLPFELTLDNKLNRLSENKLLDGNPKLPVFKNDKSVFLDSRIVEMMKDAEELPPSWLSPNLQGYLTVLHEHIDKYNQKNKRWLRSLISLIVNSDENEISEAISELNELEVIYQYDELFARLKSDTDSPILIKKEEIPNIDLLAKTGMQLVHPEYVEIYRPLLKWNAYELIAELNSHSLVKHLVRMPEDEYVCFKDKDTREYLVDLLAQDIDWIEELNDLETGWFNDIPFIVTESDNIYAKSEDERLYLPAGFQPPKHIHSLKGEYEIISVVDYKQHAMYKKMGFDEQNPINYLKQIIIPFMEGAPSDDDVLTISAWLANSWKELTSNLDKDKKEELISTLAESEIVPDSSCNLSTALKYYNFEYFSNLPIFLQDKKYLPFKFEDYTTQKNWSDFLCELGSSTTIFPEHIVTTTESIIENENADKSIMLLNYISNHFEWFDGMKYEDINIFDYLSGLEWIPVEKSGSRILVPEKEYRKLRNPSELILKNDHKIAGGSHYVLSSRVKLGKKDEDGEFSEKEIAEKLGLLVRLPNESVFDSFRRLRSVNSHQNFNKWKLDYSKEFYKYLGRSHIPGEDIPDDIKNKSIYVKGHWLPSHKVFQTPINLTGIYSWNELIEKDGKESDLAEGLKKLGVVAQPDQVFLTNYLCDIPQNQKLDKQQLKDAKAILVHFQRNLEDMYFDEIPLVTRSDHLVLSDELYIRDLPAYNKSAQKNDQLNFCQGQFEPIAKHCGVVSLAEKITPKIDADRSRESEEYNSNSWDEYIRSDPFKLAVLRLIYHEGKISEDEIDLEFLNTIFPSKVLLMESLTVSYSIDETWIYDDLYTPTYQDTENGFLYLLNQEDDEDMCESIAKFISDTSGLERDDFSLINRILRHKLNSPETITDLLDKKNIKSLPEKIKMDEALSLYGKIGVADEPEAYKEPQPNIDTEEDKIPSHEISPSKERVTQSESSVSSGRQGATQSGVEIPPPINPKKPSSPNTLSDVSSPKDHDTSPGDRKGSGINSASGKGSNGSNRNKPGSKPDTQVVSSNDRMPVYVGKDKEVASNEQSKSGSYATEVGNKGENYVLERQTDFLLSKSNHFQKAPTNNKGFDIQEVDSSGEIVRYIEVKTLTGRWGEGGVAVTDSQLEFAQVYDNWWLFIVENINTQNTAVHLIENPVQQANRFMFDQSWKQLSETAKMSQAVAPKEGDRYLISGSEYETCSVEAKGKLYKLRLKEIESGKEVTKKFDPSWETC